MTRIYTRGGDGGDTSLFGGERVRKSHPRVRACGEVDELSSAIGVAVAGLEPGSEIASTLIEVQRALGRVGGVLGDPSGKAGVVPPGAAETRGLEEAIDRLGAERPELRRFILPGGSDAGARLHVARAVCRRVERAVVELEDGGEVVAGEILAYLNRLSDFLFVAARAANRRAGEGEEVQGGER
jgi:cob(I)alamin adenosyltransferase